MLKTPFDRRLDQLGSEECEGEGEVDLTQGASFALCERSASTINLVTISSSQRRPRAIALTRRARRSARSGRMFSRVAPFGSRTLAEASP
jgi:hypothetical protein